MTTKDDRSLVGWRLRIVRDRHGWTQAEFADLLGVSSRSYQTYELGQREISIGAVRILAQEHKISPLWLLTGKGPTFLNGGMESIEERIREIESVLLSEKELESFRGRTDYAYKLIGTDAVPVAWFESVRTMPKGSIEGPFSDYWPISIRLLQELDIYNAENVFLMRASDDAMKGTYEEGDILLLDTNRRSADDPGIYAFIFNKTLSIRRIHTGVDGSLLIKSDNPKYETERIDPGDVGKVNIFGRIVWYGVKA